MDALWDDCWRIVGMNGHQSLDGGAVLISRVNRDFTGRLVWMNKQGSSPSHSASFQIIFKNNISL